MSAVLGRLDKLETQQNKIIQNQMLLLKNHNNMLHDRLSINEKKLKNINKKNSNKIMGTCSICLEAMFKKDTVTVNCNGRHKYHKKCIEYWKTRKSTCPQCRQDI